jgi:DUF1009 family protein
MQPKLGIIAGGGKLPRRIIDICRASDRAHYVIAIEGHAVPEYLEDTPHSWIRIGTAGSGFQILKDAGVREVVMIGDIKLPSLKEMRPDFRTAKFFAKIGAKSLGDNSLLSAAAEELEKEGFKVIGVDDLLDNLLAPEGVLGHVPVSDIFAEDIELGINAAKKLGEQDIGQAVIVKAGHVIAEENETGTAEMVKRSMKVNPDGTGGLLIKLKKPGQDRRMDLPTIGVNTVEQAQDAGLRGIIVQAEQSLIIDLDAVISAADEAGIFVQAIRLDEAD